MIESYPKHRVDQKSLGNACPMENGQPKSVVARIVAQTTRSDDDKDVELNIPAWTEMMGARAALPRNGLKIFTLES